MVPRGRLLVVSPHLDDAAFSCAALLERAEAVDVLTVCAGRPDPPRTGAWDRWTGFPDSDASIAARRREEIRAFEGTPHRVVMLDLLEGQYVKAPRPRADADELERALGKWADDGSGTVAIPAAAGRRHRFPSDRVEKLITAASGPRRHPDHLFVRDVALDALAGRPDIDLLVYAELLYQWGRKPDRELARIARSRGLTARQLELPVDRSAKAARIAAYESQVSHLFPERGRLDDERTLPPTERYWWLR